MPYVAEQHQIYYLPIALSFLFSCRKRDIFTSFVLWPILFPPEAAVLVFGLIDVIIFRNYGRLVKFESQQQACQILAFDLI